MGTKESQLLLTCQRSQLAKEIAQGIIMYSSVHLTQKLLF